MNNDYGDIIHLPHHVSSTRPQMSLMNRAAQFSPFAALSGFEANIKETARLTFEQVAFAEDAKVVIDTKLRILNDAIARQPEAIITFFQPDYKKVGGDYVNVDGRVKKIDTIERVLILSNGKKVCIDDIFEIESPLFENMPD